MADPELEGTRSIITYNCPVLRPAPATADRFATGDIRWPVAEFLSETLDPSGSTTTTASPNDVARPGKSLLGSVAASETGRIAVGPLGTTFPGSPPGQTRLDGRDGNLKDPAELGKAVPFRTAGTPPGFDRASKASIAARTGSCSPLGVNLAPGVDGSGPHDRSHGLVGSYACLRAFQTSGGTS